MKKRTIVATICVLALLATTIFALVACKPSPPAFVDTTKLEVRMNGDYYVGINTYIDGEISDTFDLKRSTRFANATFSWVSGTGATLEGSNLKVTTKDSKAVIKITIDGVTESHNLIFVDAINVADFAEAEKAVNTDKRGAVIHNEITAVATSKPLFFPSNTGMYGNGYVINAEAIAQATIVNKKPVGGEDILHAKGENVTMRDFQILGKDMRQMPEAEAAAFDIVNLERYGALIRYQNDDKNAKIGGTITNVVVENSHKAVIISGTTVKMEGCIIKNASDSLVSIGAEDNGGTRLTMKNNVLMNAVVAGIVMYGWNKTNDFADLTIEGFLDIYNWKESQSAKIMPTTEDFHEAANGLVAGELAAKKNRKYIYTIGDLKYVHTGIVIISTGKLIENNAKVNGVIIRNVVTSKNSVALAGTDNYVIRAFPVPKFASVILKTSALIGYGNTAESKNVHIKPDTRLTDAIYGELRNGRVAK